MYDVVIIGAGASGLMLSSILKKENKDIKILLLEKNSKIGKKLLITGNGKCNLGNNNMSINAYNKNEYFNRYYNYLADGKYLKYLNSFGLMIKHDNEGRIYPYNEQAIAVCKMFERNIKEFDINIKYDYIVSEVIKVNNMFIVNNEIKAKIVVIATGGMSYPKTGSTGDGYNILKIFGHKIENPYPSLVKLKTDYQNIKLISGVRANASIKLCVNDNVESYDIGQVQFTDNYISGICVFNLSRNVKRYLNENKKVEIKVDLVPDIDFKELNNYLKSFSENKIIDILSGIINNKLADAITKDLKLINKKVKEISEDKFAILVNYVKNMIFNIIDTADFNEAQVTSGGACLYDFNEYLESKYVDNLYAIGEVLDVDGICGGYNLAWAFISGLLVADRILKLYR